MLQKILKLYHQVSFLTYNNVFFQNADPFQYEVMENLNVLRKSLSHLCNSSRTSFDISGGYFRRKPGIGGASTSSGNVCPVQPVI